ncbi:hypothetical protein Tco_0648531 [Tanacetum coccineum]
MDAMIVKMDAQYKELQSRAKQLTPDLDDDDMPMSREEEAKFMKTFHKTRFYNDYRDRDSNRDNWRSSGHNDYNQDNYRSNTDDEPYDLQKTIQRFHEISTINQLLYEGSKILHSIKGTLLKEEIFSKFDEFMAMSADENFESESDTKEPPFEKITINTDYKINTYLEENPTDLELKPLPDNLEYVFLEEPSFLPVIISSKLSAQNKSKLISVLKKHKEAFD